MMTVASSGVEEVEQLTQVADFVVCVSLKIESTNNYS